MGVASRRAAGAGSFDRCFVFWRCPERNKGGDGPVVDRAGGWLNRRYQQISGLGCAGARGRGGAAARRTWVDDKPPPPVAPRNGLYWTRQLSALSLALAAAVLSRNCEGRWSG